MSKRLIVLLHASAIVSCAPPPPAPQLANPASAHRIEQGGRHVVERGSAGEFGVCLFEDNRQCEEWALLRGHCPVGGRRVTGYATPAARYCAITGGSYSITGRSGAADEQGTCGTSALDAR
jgi:putative hemolysin